jgi:hypothetical protein
MNTAQTSVNDLLNEEMELYSSKLEALKALHKVLLEYLIDDDRWGRYVPFERTEVVKIVPCTSDQNSNDCISRTSNIFSV